MCVNNWSSTPMENKRKRDMIVETIWYMGKVVSTVIVTELHNDGIHAIKSILVCNIMPSVKLRITWEHRAMIWVNGVLFHWRIAALRHPIITTQRLVWGKSLFGYYWLAIKPRLVENIWQIYILSRARISGVSSCLVIGFVGIPHNLERTEELQWRRGMRFL